MPAISVQVCMTLGLKWAYNPHDTYKTTKTIVQTLVNVVATGGSLLLDVGPMPTGELPPVALSRLAETGQWMDVNSESIHETVPQAPYAMTVQAVSAAGRSSSWGLTSPKAAGQSASCPEAGSNTRKPLEACKKLCEETAGCNTLNFNAPDTCIIKNCNPAGTPLTTKDGGFVSLAPLPSTHS
eukprot:SAG31_NODE_3373_length_4351_cov_2.070790_3_plen_183_part_00